MRRLDSQDEEGEAKSTFRDGAIEAVGQFLRALLDLRRRHPDNVVIVTYEEMSRMPARALARMFSCLGVTDAPVIVARCIH